MVGLRRIALLVSLVLGAALAGCGRGDRPRLGPDVTRALNRGRQQAAAWVARGRSEAEPGGETAIALGYLERLRLGLGSPFRLIDYALLDPRLGDSTRVRLGWALLARTLDGQAYQVDPSALDGIGLGGIGSRVGAGRHHLELIGDAVSEAPDPRGGELAVRLAYALASAEGGVTHRGPRLATQAAAMIRDRELARADALRLIRAAEAAKANPLRLTSEWRIARRFAVEQPPMASIPQQVEREAMERAPRLASAILALAPRLADAGSPRPPFRGAALTPLLGPAAARTLAALADSLNAPPQTPVVVAVDVHRRELTEDPRTSNEDREAGQRFLERARNEERLAAAYASYIAETGSAAPAGAVLSAAVGLRTYAQERVWFPGFGGPTARELEDRFGLAFVRFDNDVPSTWRPYYRRMLAGALGDLQRVLPSLDLRGLGVRVGESRSRSATLAVHDPRRRTIFLPPETGAGTIAHEVAHDVDWQVALRRYRIRGDYGSDRATRVGRDRLARTIQRLTTATLRPPMPGDPTPVAHGRRPAEVFARSVDWFVVVSLAREGRVNGYLSSAQDDMLTGYGTVTPPDITGDAGQALVTILDEVAPVYPATRDWFLKSYGPNRAHTAHDLVRRVIEPPGAEGELGEPLREIDPQFIFAYTDAEAPAPPGMALVGAVRDRFAELEAARDAALAAIDAWICRAPAAAYDPAAATARRRLVAHAAAARARGLALGFADALTGHEGRHWLTRRFYGAPWPTAAIDSTAAGLLDALAEEARQVGDVQIDAAPVAFRLAATPPHCNATGLLPGG